MIQMEPLLSLCLAGSKRQFSAGDELVCEYQIDAVDPNEIQAVEASVLWYTEGKGEEDLGVHFFERRLPTDAEDGDLRRGTSNDLLNAFRRAYEAQRHQPV